MMYMDREDNVYFSRRHIITTYYEDKEKENANDIYFYLDALNDSIHEKRVFRKCIGE